MTPPPRRPVCAKLDRVEGQRRSIPPSSAPEAGPSVGMYGIRRFSERCRGPLRTLLGHNPGLPLEAPPYERRNTRSRADPGRIAIYGPYRWYCTTASIAETWELGAGSGLEEKGESISRNPLFWYLDPHGHGSADKLKLPVEVHFYQYVRTICRSNRGRGATPARETGAPAGAGILPFRAEGTLRAASPWSSR